MSLESGTGLALSLYLKCSRIDCIIENAGNISGGFSRRALPARLYNRSVWENKETCRYARLYRGWRYMILIFLLARCRDVPARHVSQRPHPITGRDANSGASPESKIIWILNCKFNDVQSGIANSAQQGAFLWFELMVDVCVFKNDF